MVESKSSFLRRFACSDLFERAAASLGATRIAGVDEVGRGTLFGPVTAAAVILPANAAIDGIHDSKLISPQKRIRLAELIKRQAIAWSVADVTAEMIDSINIANASVLAMEEAVHGLEVIPDYLLVDAFTLDLDVPQRAIEHGDALSVSIAAASIVAKVHRDEQMLQYDLQYPGYGLREHKGYGTAMHLEQLQLLGPTPLHRRSFGPVRRVCTSTRTIATSISVCLEAESA